MSEIRKERERERTREREEKKRQEAEEDSSETGDDGGQKTSKTEAREPDSSSLPYPVSSPLASACQLATRRQTHPSLSFVLMPTRLHAFFPVVVSFFYPRQPNSCLRSSLSPPRRTSFLAALVSFFVTAFSRESFRFGLSALHVSCERVCNVDPSTSGKDSMEARPQLFNSSMLNFRIIKHELKLC